MCTVHRTVHRLSCYMNMPKCSKLFIQIVTETSVRETSVWENDCLGNVRYPQLSACTPLYPTFGWLSSPPLIDNTESGLRNPYGFLTLNHGPRTSLAAESRTDLYLAHVSSREKYEVKKEIMRGSVCGMGLVCTWRTARLAGVEFLKRGSQRPPHQGQRSQRGPGQSPGIQAEVLRMPLLTLSTPCG